MFSKIASVLGAGVLAAGGMVLSAAPAGAETNPHCARSTQIGSTAYIKSGDTTIGSVKQYKGCDRNYAYTYVWDGFSSSHSDWEVCTSVASGRSAPFSLEDLRCHGKKKDNWSAGAATLDVCTHAVGNIRWGGNEPKARTSIRC